MKKRHLTLLIILSMFIIPFSSNFADERPNADIILVIDKSLSMIDKIEPVKQYVETSILGPENVQIGDFLIIVNFYGQAELLNSFEIASEADRAKAGNIISSIFTNPGQTHTDIGNALDVAQREITSLTSSDRPKVILLVTDGIQEAPKTSKYYSPDGTFSHRLLDMATPFAKQGWKLFVIEIGESEATRFFTEKLGGTYKSVSDTPTEQELEGTIDEFRGTIILSQRPELISVPDSGKAEISLELKSQGFSADQLLQVKEARISGYGITETDVLEKQQEYSMPKDGSETVVLPLSFPLTLEPGDYQTDVSVIFEGENQFTPNVFSLRVHINSFFENYPWLLILLIIAVLALLALGVFFIIKFIGSRGVKFRVLVEEQPLKKGMDIFSLGEGNHLYLNESMGYISVVKTRSMRSYGRIAGIKNNITFEPLKEKFIIGFKRERQNMIGHQITLKSEKGALFHITFLQV
ncbi:MAG: VWA domain-containing protein [Spirochaetales bacterium]|nr:VWA domain-containing protein [Spirochaetales bacterium]